MLLKAFLNSGDPAKNLGNVGADGLLGSTNGVKFNIGEIFVSAKVRA